MTEILDLIHSVFEEIEQTKKEKNESLVLQKEIELDNLGKDLVKVSKTKGSVLSLSYKGSSKQRI
jgi:hypothetical protein